MIAYAFFAAAVLSAVLLLVHRPTYRPLAVLLGCGLALDVLRLLARVFVLAPSQALACGYSGGAAAVFLASEIGYLAWSAGVAGGMLKFFFGCKKSVVMLLGAVAAICLIACWPFDCAGLETFHTFLHVLVSLVFVACLAKLMTSSVVSLECVSALILGSTEVLLLVGPYARPDAPSRWSLAILGYEVAFVVLTLLQIGAFPCRSMSPPWFSRFKSFLRPFGSR